jgi:hypothetical protein
MKSRKFFLMLVSVLLMIGLFAGCAAQSEGESLSAGQNFDKSPVDVAPMETIASSDNSASVSSAMPTDQKLIRTIRISAETEAMDPLLTQVNARIVELGGYIESQDVYSKASGRTRSAKMVIRIPAEQLDAFVGHVQDASNVTTKSETTQNITTSYIATESRIKALETEEARLLELVAKADSLDALLKLESRLTDIRAELEKLNTQLRSFDNQVSYGTIHLNITEVQTYTVVEEEPLTLWGRVKAGFAQSLDSIGELLEKAVVVLAIMLPYLAVPIIAGIIVLVLVRRSVKKKRKEQKPPADTQQ